MKFSARVSLCIALAALLHCAVDAQEKVRRLDAHLTNIVDTAVAANFTTLAAALTKANLVETLSGAGPFTVFAPTDAAFEAALAALGITAEELLAKADLGDILKFHVASGKVMSTDLSNGMNVTTLEGSELTVTIDGTTVKIGDATVTTADVEASNGVIHIIDAVLLPPAPAAPAPAPAPEGEANVDAAGVRLKGFGFLGLASSVLWSLVTFA